MHVQNFELVTKHFFVIFINQQKDLGQVSSTHIVVDGMLSLQAVVCARKQREQVNKRTRKTLCT